MHLLLSALIDRLVWLAGLARRESTFQGFPFFFQPYPILTGNLCPRISYVKHFCHLICLENKGFNVTDATLDCVVSTGFCEAKYKRNENNNLLIFLLKFSPFPHWTILALSSSVRLAWVANSVQIVAMHRFCRKEEEKISDHWFPIFLSPPFLFASLSFDRDHREIGIGEENSR